MARQKIINIHSNVVSNGVPKKPNASDIEKGEIAVNYATGKEKLFIKNEGGGIVDFSTTGQIDDKLAEK